MRNKTMWIYGAIVFCLSVLSEQVLGCHFRAEWRGRWYQSALGIVHIHGTSVEGKGKCIENERDFYLLYNENEKCSICLLMMGKHPNLIQYRESYCRPNRNLDGCRNDITVELPLHTLIKDASSPIPCPFSGVYRYQYNNNSFGFCNKPQSHLLPCAGEANFKFAYKECPDMIDSRKQDLMLECLATWKDGSDMFLYGLFNGDSIRERDKGFRCFKYKTVGNDLHMSMSADASCRGLMSPTEGPMVMKMKKDYLMWSDQVCYFPDWLRNQEWRDLSGNHIYQVSENGRSLSVIYNYDTPHHRHHRGAKGPPLTTYRCMKVLYEADDELVITSLKSHKDCKSQHHCLSLRRRGTEAIEVHQGNFGKKPVTSCPKEAFEEKHRGIIIPENSGPISCPMEGHYIYTNTTTNCQTELHSGCNRTSVMRLDGTCRQKPLYLECLQYWKEYNSTYLVARNAEGNRNMANCFVFSKEERYSTFTTDSICNKGIAHLYKDPLQYSISNNRELCIPPTQKSLPSVITEDVNNTAVILTPIYTILIFCATLLKLAVPVNHR